MKNQIEAIKAKQLALEIERAESDSFAESSKIFHQISGIKMALKILEEVQPQGDVIKGHFTPSDLNALLEG
jgi:hypothetical protein